MNNYGLDINGNSSHCVKLPKETKLFGDSFTKEFWLYYRNRNIRQIILGDFDESLTSNTNIEIYSDNTIRLYWNLGEIDKKFNIVEQNKWIHISWVRDKENNRHIFYKNGEKIFETDTAGSDLKCEGIQWLGRDGRNSMILNGIIDELRIWDKALTQEEIKHNMNKIVSPNSKNLIAYYRFDRDKGNTIIDLTRNENNGYIDSINLTNSTPDINYYKILLKQNDNYYTIKSEFYRNGQYQPLLLEDGVTTNGNEFINKGFDNLNLLTTKYDKNSEVAVSKSIMGEGKYFEVEFSNDFKRVNSVY